MDEAGAQVEGVNRLLSDNGHRLTTSRTLILRIIAESEVGIGAEQIYAQARQANGKVNLSTVYRNLDMLMKLHLVSAVAVDGCLRYRLLQPGRPQHYLVCNYCGRVQEVNLMYLAPLRERLLMGYNFEPEFGNFTVHGRCNRCRSGGMPRQEDYEIDAE